MSRMPPDDPNFFEPPRAGIGDRVLEFGDTDAEATRRQYLNHEASVRAIGALDYLAAIGSVVVGVYLLLVVAGVASINQIPAGFTADTFRLFALIAGVVLMPVAILYAVLGHGVRQLKPWARWTTLGLFVFGFVVGVGQLLYLYSVNPELAGQSFRQSIVSYLIQGYIFYLFASAKGAMVFSPAYREVVLKTPHIKYKMGCLVKGLLAVLGAVILLIVLALIFAPRG